MGRFSIEELRRSWLDERAARQEDPSPERLGRILAAAIFLRTDKISRREFERLILSDPWPDLHIDVRVDGRHIHEFDRMMGGMRMANIAFPDHWSPWDMLFRYAHPFILDEILDRARHECPKAAAWAEKLARGMDV